ncbi:hypothetical protein M433DRAFT_205241 [Acidomyces richmondensis BFW]|nr:MAG: hypothetical protein FE78DRAFT_368636 [Acidomyces sp. 'richmondensis']KYG49966.1 hypothetical protein M433DRAFT_205241 [Acidomyces richmondensis BFW]
MIRASVVKEGCEGLLFHPAVVACSRLRAGGKPATARSASSKILASTVTSVKSDAEIYSAELTTETPDEVGQYLIASLIIVRASRHAYFATGSCVPAE